MTVGASQPILTGRMHDIDRAWRNFVLLQPTPCVAEENALDEIRNPGLPRSLFPIDHVQGRADLSKRNVL